MSETPYDPDWRPDDDEGDDGEYFEDDEERDEEEDEPDNEALAAFYMAEQEEFNTSHAAFIERYGFEHNCRCAEDWDEGNLGVVSMCYLGMATDAMNTLADKMLELKEVNREIAKLRIELADRA